MYEKIFYAGWGDMDFNSHMRNTAYLDKSADIRMMYFAEYGFSTSEFARLRFGPVVFRDELEYYKEIGLHQEIRVSFSLAGLSVDGSRFKIRNEFHGSDGKRCAVVMSTGGWLDLNTRKLMKPPEALLKVLQSSPQTDSFQTLASSLK